jgi:NAD(P)-dependent dehydrogenase (short-subunit alcohol dehydrogenase family)
MALPDLRGRTAVVTGASRGLGAGLAESFAGRGLRLALCARSHVPAPPGAEVLIRQLDVCDAAAVDAFAEEAAKRFGRIDLWVNNAGVLEPIAPLRDVRPADFARHVEINLFGVFHGTRAFVRHLRARDGQGVLINVSSGAARKAYAGWSAYCAAKAAVDRMTEAVQLEEGAHGLRAYAVAPGIVDTDMQALIRAASPEDFPEVGRFLEFEREGAFNSPGFVAEHLLRIAFDPAADPGEVLVRLPDEHAPA